MAHHKGKEPGVIAKPLTSAVMSEVCEDAFDAALVDGLCNQDLYDLILAANFMDCSALLHLGAAKVASMVKVAHLSPPSNHIAHASARHSH
jgi:hypothetical protein